jgi:uncharacterized protein YcbX
MSGSVAWISFTPVKGLRLQQRDEARLTADGIPGDRAFFLVDERGAMVSVTRLGPLLAVESSHDADAGALTLRFPGGGTVAGPVELGAPEAVRFYDETLLARPVEGGFSAALSEHCGRSARASTAAALAPPRSSRSPRSSGCVRWRAPASRSTRGAFA